MWPHDFAQWYCENYPLAYAAVYRDLRRRGVPHQRASDLAEEAVQEAMLRAARYAARPGYFHNQTHFRAWIIVTARRQARHLAFGRGPIPWPEHFDLADPRAAPDDHLALFHACWSQLGQRAQLILRMYYWEGLTDVEIGQILFDPAEGTPEALGQRARNLRLAAMARLLGSMQGRGLGPWDFFPGSGSHP